MLKEKVFILGSDEALMSKQEYMQKVDEDVAEDDDFNSGAWVNATNYVIANGGSSCSPNVLGDLTMTMKDLSGIIPGTVHHKVIGKGGYENDIIVGATLILANVSVFSSKPSMHYLNITMRNVVKVFRKDTVLGSGSAKKPQILDLARKDCTALGQEAKGMSSAASPPNFLPFLHVRFACASRAIGALLSSYSSLDGSNGLRRSFPTKIKKAVSHRDVNSFSAPNEMGNL
nr:hypothetical protein [Tanacetum cinerariifolium]